MTTPFGYIGIDFGTSNSHFAFCNHSDRPIAESVGIGKGGSMPTCVLWKKPGETAADLLAYGEHAQSQWIGMDDDERVGVRFAFGFKPDLVPSARARKDAWGFLTAAASDLKQAGLAGPIGPGGYHVIIGVPAEIGAEHKAITARLASDAGLGEVECVEEPLGALAYHLSRGDLSGRDARRGVLVVDFGGGTFDVALANHRGLAEPWGDPSLGGRLFDDLFLQWVLDQNPGLEVSEEEALVVWQNECRRVKEDFSNAWAAAAKQDKPFPDDFKRPVEVGGRKVWLRKPTVEEFRHRASRYTPSHVVRKYIRGLDQPVGGLVLDQPTDLFARIRDVLCRGNTLGGMKDKFTRVVLTGGSSWWPFLKELVGDALGVPADKVLMSQNPQATIGSGLALYRTVREGNERRQQEIKARVPEVLRDFNRSVSARLDRYAATTADAVIQALMPRIEREYWGWYDHGGSLNGVEARVKLICQDFEKTQGEACVRPHWVAVNADLIRIMREHLGTFLRANEIPSGVEDYIPTSVTSIADWQSGGQGTGDKLIGGLGNMAGVLTALSAIALVILAVIKVKVIASIVVAAMTVPPLAAALGVVALIASIAAGAAAKQALEDAIKKHEFNAMTGRALRLVLWRSSFEEKLKECRAEASAQLRAAFRKETIEGTSLSATGEVTRALEPAILAKFEQVVGEVVTDLGVLDQVRGGA
ncbi:MAG: Hsp70 family protein [Fimbriiglobus sp.]|nr:Hsp70 family protein [Fimbriiglobus sp.]